LILIDDKLFLEDYMYKNKSRYTPSELKKALDLIEEGYSMTQVCDETNLNKSILAREMRKRKNEKAMQQIKQSSRVL
jgi:DNA-binding phage protein